MESLLIYLLNASAGIALFFAVYWLFLRKETFHTSNRWFLIGSLLLAVLLPLTPVQYKVLVEAQGGRPVVQTISDTFKNIPVFTGTEERSSGFSWQQAVLLVYLTGAAIFMLRLLSQTIILLSLMVKYRIKSFNGVHIVENEKYGLPFSFFNIIFINPKFHTQDELPEILAHEKVHIRENHWFDLLFIELLTVIFWFNPFIWLFERAIKQNHEYLADKGVLAQGHTVARYQALLVNQLMGMQIIGITNNLNFALSTNRFKMMTKKKTSATRLIRFTWALPVLALLLFAFAEPQYQTIKSDSSENGVLVEKDATGKKLTINGKVVNQETGDPIWGASVIIKGTAIGTISGKDGSFVLVDPNAEVDENGGLSSEVVVSFVGLKTVTNKISTSGSAHNKASYTFLMEDEVIYASACYDTTSPKETKKQKVEDAPAPPPPPPAPKVNTEEEVFIVVEDLPKFPGGPEALAKYVQNVAESYNLSGKAKIGFTVNSNGKVSDVKIVEKDSDQLGTAAAEIISELPLWKPGMQRGKAVPVKYLIAVEFK